MTHRDIEADGFPASLAGCCDAAFLDLPGPWKCIPSVARSLRPDGVVCSFSPCIEQVQRTCEALEQHGFGDTRTVELLGREYDVEVKDMQRDLSVEQPKMTNRWRREAKEKAKRKRVRVEGGNGEEGEGRDGVTARKSVMAHPRQVAQSHTGYLTFARLVPYAKPEEARTARETGAKTRGVGQGRGGRGGGGGSNYHNDDELSD